MSLDVIITMIELLERKVENGTITMDQEVQLNKLVELAEEKIYA